MFGAGFKFDNDLDRVKKATDVAAYRNFGHAAASVRKEAIASISKAPKEQTTRARRRGGKVIRRATHRPSKPGMPPHTNKGLIRRAILFKADNRGAVVGTARSKFGTAGQAHEHGGRYKGQQYPKRQFMFPALKRQAFRFAGEWRGSIGS